MVDKTLAVLSVVIILTTPFAISQEMGDPTDLGNEMPNLFVGILVWVNRFV